MTCLKERWFIIFKQDLYLGVIASARLQIVEVIEPADRPKRLLELLKRHHSSRKNRVLVFVLYKREAGTVEAALQGAGWKVVYPVVPLCILH